MLLHTYFFKAFWHASNTKGYIEELKIFFNKIKVFHNITPFKAWSHELPITSKTLTGEHNCEVSTTWIRNNKVNENRETGRYRGFSTVAGQVKRGELQFVSWKSSERCSSSTVSSLERVFVEVVEWLLRRAQTKCISCCWWRRLLDCFQDTLVIDPPDWSKCSHSQEGPHWVLFFFVFFSEKWKWFSL